MILIIVQVIGLVVCFVGNYLNETINCRYYDGRTRRRIRVILSVLTFYFVFVPLCMYLRGYQGGFIIGTAIVLVPSIFILFEDF
jgi:hypothetical protein